MRAILFGVLPGVVVAAPLDQPAAASPVIQVRIEAAPLSAALRELARQTGLQIARFSDDTTARLRVGPVTGELTSAQALEQLLVGTGLTYRFVNERTVAIVRIPALRQPEVVNPVAEAASGLKAEERSVGNEKGKTIMRHRGFWARFAAVLGLCIPAAGVVCAQEPGQEPASELEEIMVTATKRQASLQDVPISISAVSGDTLDRRGISDSREILLSMSNVEIKEQGSQSAANIFIRGVGVNGVDFALQSGVGVFSDEIVLNSLAVNVLQVYDLERVEVLKGPQNTLYGRNTTGGAVNFISRKPVIGRAANGYVDLSYGRYNDLNVKGALGMPLGESAALRVAGMHESRDGIRLNLLTGRKYEERSKDAGRVQLAWQPTERVEVNFKLHAERIDAEPLTYLPLGLADPNNTALPCSAPGTPGLCAATASGYVPPVGEFVFSDDITRPREKIDASGGLARVDVSFDAFTLTSITGYEQNTLERFEGDGLPEPWFHWSQQVKQDQWSQEFRLTSSQDRKLRWIGGLYGFWESTDGTTGPLFGPGEPSGFPNNILVVRGNSEFDTSVYAGYGELEYDLAPQVTLRGGLRLGSDYIKGRSVAVAGPDSRFPGIDFTTPLYTGSPLPDFMSVIYPAAVAGGAMIVEVGGPNHPDDKINGTRFNNWGAKLGVDWKPTSDVLVYGSWSRGFKAGSFNPSPMNVLQGIGDRPYEEEVVNAYELGSKTEFLNGRARFNAAVFFLDYANQQLTQFHNGELLVLTADSEVYGLEVDAGFVPAKGLNINFGAGYLHSKVTDAPSPTQIGNRLIGAPDWTLNMSINKEWMLASGPAVGIGVDGRYTTSAAVGLGDPVTGYQFEVDSYFLANAQLYCDFGSSHQYRLSLWGRNINDATFQKQRFNGFAPLADHYVPGDPRTYGLAIRASF